MEKELSKAERTRQFIIETTAPIFNKKGYAGTSMSDLTAATGLTTVVYRPTKSSSVVVNELSISRSGSSA